VSVLSLATQVEVESRLVSDGIISEDQLSQSRSEAEKSNTPLLTYLVHNKQIDDEQLAKVTAEVTNTLYVNLANSKIDTEALSLLPQEIAERYMAIPLGEMQNRLVVAMLDADNIQAVDFLSNKIGRPLKVYAASESGIRQALKQYTLSLGDSMSDAFGNSESSADVATVNRQKQQHQNNCAGFSNQQGSFGNS
jgi:type IV pilus assembly protein PilB